HRSALVEHARDRDYRNVRLTRHVTDRRPHLDLLAGVPPSPSDPPTAGRRAGGAAVPLALETFTMLRHGMQAFRYSTAERRAPVRVGLTGYGMAGRYLPAPLTAAVQGLEAAAVVTRDTARAAQERAEYPGVRIVDDPDSLLHSDDIELVVIATPNRKHASLALAALDPRLLVYVD